MNNSNFTTPKGTKLPKCRKRLSADALINMLHSEFAKFPEVRSGNVKIPLQDALMSGYAVFALKDSSLLDFDRRRKEEDPNLKRVFGLSQVPCDTQLRAILDKVNPELLRRIYKRVFARLQRGKALEQMRFLDNYYLISGDGTGYYSSQKVVNSQCQEKKSSSTGEITFYQQCYAAALVNPNLREVIPLFPEPMIKQDGQTKNDCERNASRRFMEGFRKDHPHLPVVILEDALHSNAPHIRDLQRHNLRFIIGAKQSDHKHLFRQADLAEKEGRAVSLTLNDPKNPRIKHYFFFVNDLPLNQQFPA